MAKLESIYISGIRSFNIHIEDPQEIKFYSPLTLFLGQNGCGKTTIIEALKYAITGDLPAGTANIPNGACFVSDPSLHGRDKVLGKIMLKIRGPNNEEMSVTRTMQLEQNNNKFTSLDGTLTYLTPGTEEVLISGCAGNLSEKMIQMLKVPRAILNNVIFCHQEKSLWPLEDSGAKLKKKFDEIFGCDKYTKCVETLRNIHKDRMTHINNTLKVNSRFMEGIKIEVERKQAILTDKETKFQEIEIEITTKERMLESIVKRVAEICEVQSKILVLKSELSGKQNDKLNIEQHEESIKENLKNEYAGSDSELQDELKMFNCNKTKDEQKMAKLESDKEELMKLENTAVEAVQKNTAIHAQLKEKVTQYQSKIKERNGLIHKMGETIKQSVSTSLETDVVDTINVLSAFEKDEKAALEKLGVTHEKINENLQKKVDECRNKVIQIEQDIKNTKQYKSNLEKESRGMKSQLHELNISDDQLKSVQNKLATIEVDLIEIKKNFDLEVAAVKIEKEAKHIKEIEHELEDLDMEHKILQRNSITENELENIKSGYLEREVDVQKMINEHLNKFNDLFGSETIPNSNIKTQIQEIQTNFNNQVTDLQNKILLKKDNFVVLDTNYGNQNKLLSTLTTELQDKRDKVANFCGTMSYTEKCAEIAVEYNGLVQKRGELDAARIMYEKFIEDFSAKKCCPICSTDFDDKAAAVKDIIDIIKGKIEMIPIELMKNNTELEVVGELHKKSLYLKSDHDRISKLEEIIIPNLKSEIEDLKIRSDRDESEWESLKNDLKIPLNKISVCNAVIGDAALIDQYRSDMEKSRAKIECLQTQIVTVKSEMNLENCEAKIYDLKADISMARQNWDTENEKLNQYRMQRQNLGDDQIKFKEQQLKLEKLMHGQPQLVENILVNSRKQEALEKEIAVTESSLVGLQKHLSEAEIDKSTTKEKNKSILTTARNDFTETQNALIDIMKLQANIVSISNEKLVDHFNTVYEKLVVLKDRQQDINSKKNEAIDKITEVRLLLGNRDSIERSLKDNVVLREKRKEYSVILTEIKRLTYEIENSEQILIDERDILEKRQKDIDGEIQRSRGKMEELKIIINDIEKDLNKSDNKNACNSYLHKVIELNTTVEANDNTKMYMDALDNAIVVLHKTGMKQINETIRQLWRQIYRGNDIDYIEIVPCDTEHTGANSRRVYNYKVMQMRNATKMDMRGRCSLGQKVLACLIIRIALSETFSKDCGILALDEPTTNLDRENIEALSHSLAKIINTRRARNNFQLLVITHDEDFIRTLRAVDDVKFYYKVSRSHQGTTVITTENI